MKLNFTKEHETCFTVSAQKDNVTRNFTFAKPFDVSNDGSLITFTDKQGKKIKELPPAHFSEISINNTTFPSPKETVKALAGIINFKSGGGAYPPTPPAYNKWQPHPDWWDIKKIFDNDTDPNKRFIMLLIDTVDSITLKQSADFANANAYYKTSDEATYNGDATHNWNPAKDKPCAEGYTTRYVIVYSTDKNVACYLPSTMPFLLYIYFGNKSNITLLGGQNLKSLRAFDCSDDVTADPLSMYAFTSPGVSYSTSPHFEYIKIPNGITKIPDSCFLSFYKLRNENLIIPDSVTSAGNYSFQNCISLTKIPKYFSVSNGGGTYSGCFNISEIIIPNGTTNFPTTSTSLYGLKRVYMPKSLGTQFSPGTSYPYLNEYAVEKGFVLKGTGVSLSTYGTIISLTSHINFLNNLGDTGGVALQIVFGATILSYLNARPDGAAAIAAATNNGYTIS